MKIRDNMMKWVMLVTMVFVMVVAGEVWGIRAASSAPATPAKPRTVRMMVPREPRGEQLSPVRGFDSSRLLPLIFNLLEPLVEIGGEGKFIPKLATKWEHSADLTKWRFHLRRGVKFHNGDNFTARDVVELVKWSLEEKELSELYKCIPAKEAIPVDDYTVDFIFEKPQPILLINLRRFLLSPVAISRDNRKLAETQPVGTGPYRFVEWKRGQYVKLAKFEGYWGPKPQIDDVKIDFREEGGVRLAALMAGEADWVSDLSPEQASSAPKIAHRPSPDTIWIQFDESIQKDPIFADKNLRLAVEYAIDRKALVSMYSGMITPSPGQFASLGDFGFNPGLKSRPYDLKKARTLVREAGAEGKTVIIVAATDRYNKAREVGEAVAYMIEQTGLKVKLMPMVQDEVSKYKNVGRGGQKPTADIVLTSDPTPLEVGSYYSHMFVDSKMYRTTPDLEPTRLYKDVEAEVDYVKRGEKLGKAWAYVYEEAHYIPLFKSEWIWGLSKNMEWEPTISGKTFIADMRFTN